MRNLFVFLVLCLSICIGAEMLAQEKELTQKRVVILLGPPGSGKGTQAVRLSRTLRIPHISTGDLLRDNLNRQTELGKQAKSYMEAGKLVPDEIVLGMLFDRISQPDSRNGYLLDGFPRTIPQAETFDARLGDDVSLVVLNLKVRDALILERSEGRQTCKQCGCIYNRAFSPSKVEGKCDKCEGELYQRTDDSRAVVEERLRVYHTQTAPLIQHYKDKGVLREVNGEQTPDEVFTDLIKNFKA